MKAGIKANAAEMRSPAAQTTRESKLMIPDLKNWHDYFVKNYLNTGDFAWHTDDTLTQEEHRCIGKSIAAFQLGEYSEGRGLLKSAERFAQKCNDKYLVKSPDYLLPKNKTTRCFC